MWFSDIPYTTCSLSLYVSGSSSVCALSVSFVLSFIPYFIFSALFMLFQVLCMYSITTKHKYLSGDVFLYPVMSSSLSSFTPPLTSLFFFSKHVFMSWLPSLPLPPLPPRLPVSGVMSFRLFLKSHSGTAGRQSSLVIHGADFSTKDMDNDNCLCKCALMFTGGKCSKDMGVIRIDEKKQKPGILFSWS